MLNGIAVPYTLETWSWSFQYTRCIPSRVLYEAPRASPNRASMLRRTTPFLTYRVLWSLLSMQMIRLCFTHFPGTATAESSALHVTPFTLRVTRMSILFWNLFTAERVMPR